METSRYTDSPRARTHRGNDIWASALRVVKVINHDIPDSIRTGIAVANGSHATASAAQPYATGDAAKSTLAETFWRKGTATTTASTAPKPMAAKAIP